MSRLSHLLCACCCCWFFLQMTIISSAYNADMNNDLQSEAVDLIVSAMDADKGVSSVWFACV